MFHGGGGTINKLINHSHEKFLGILCKDYTSSFDNLHRKDTLVTVYYRNIQSLTRELFKVKQNLSKSMLYNIFQVRSSITY